MAKSKSQKQMKKRAKIERNARNRMWNRIHQPAYSPSHIPIVDNQPVWLVERIAFSPQLRFRATLLSLPTEVIARILLFAFKSSRPYSFPLNLGSTENAFRTAALSVCRRLYSIVLNIPKLWSNINIKAPPVRGKGLRLVVYQRLEAHLTRSRNQSLDIQLDVTWPEGDIRRVMKLLCTHAHRWLKLSISASGSIGPAAGAPPSLIFSLLPIKLVAGCMPRLEVVVLSYEPDGDQGQIAPIVLSGKIFCRWNTPRLQLLHLNNIDLRWVTMVVLGEFVIPPPFSGLPRLPPAFPSLTTLHIAGKSPWPARRILEAFVEQAPILRNITLRLKEPAGHMSTPAEEGTPLACQTLDKLEITVEPYHPARLARPFYNLALTRMAVLRHDFQNRNFKDFCHGTSMVIKDAPLQMAFDTLPAHRSELIVCLQLTCNSWPLWSSVSNILESLISMKKLLIRGVDVEVAISAMFHADKPNNGEEDGQFYSTHDGLIWHRLRRIRKFPRMHRLEELSIEFIHPFRPCSSDSGNHTSDCDCPVCDQQDAVYRNRAEGDNWLRCLTGSFLAIFVHNSPALRLLSLKHLTPIQWSAVAHLFPLLLDETNTFGQSPRITELVMTDIHQDRGRALRVDRNLEGESEVSSEYGSGYEEEDEDEEDTDPDEMPFGEGISSIFPYLRILELDRVPVAAFLEDLEMDDYMVDLDTLSVTHCAQARRSHASWPYLRSVLETRQLSEICVDAAFARAHRDLFDEFIDNADCLLKVVE